MVRPETVPQTVVLLTLFGELVFEGPRFVPVAAAAFAGAVPVPYFNCAVNAVVLPVAPTPYIMAKMLPLLFGVIVHVVPLPPMIGLAPRVMTVCEVAPFKVAGAAP